MKFSIAAATALAVTAAAAPASTARVLRFDRRQTTANDLKSGSCKKITLVFARASTEPGNMGMSMGPSTCSGLKQKFSGQVSCQGVGGAYSAGLADNGLPAGTTAGAIAEAQKMLSTAASKCPNTIIVAGGYSQGTAVMMNAVSKVEANVKNRIAGVVLFGYTKNAQQKSGIPNYPKEKVKVFCSTGDGVCTGTLVVTASHFSYMMDGSGPASVKFLVSQINSAKPGGDGGGSKESSKESSEEESSGGGEEAPAKGKGKAKKGKKGGKRVVEGVAAVADADDGTEEASQ